MECWRNILLRWILVCGLILTKTSGRHLHGPNSAVEKESSSTDNSESREDDTSVQAEQIATGCCERQRHIILAGYDISGRQIELDVGRCRKTCDSRQHLHRLQDDPPTDLNITKAILQSVRRSASSCPRHSSCEPTHLARERVHLVGDPTEYDVIQECRCQPKPQDCERQPRHVTIFPDSPYQTIVDVGVCTGRCQQGDSIECRSIKNKTITVEGPEGKECIDVIEECGCTSECYRVPHREVYYEVMYDKKQNRTVENLKEIDIGRCIGTCSSGNHLRCVMRSRANPAVCLMSLVKKNVACLPKTYTTHEFVSPGGAAKTVLAINDCSCK